jgi:hypothetical protein
LSWAPPRNAGTATSSEAARIAQAVTPADSPCHPSPVPHQATPTKR